MRQLKEISYRGGALSFRLPSDWAEEYGEKSGGTFYENAPDAGTLRLSVVLFKTKNKPDSEQLEKFLRLRPEAKTKGAQISRESNGNVVLQFIQRAQESGDEVSIVWWFVANGNFDDSMQIAMFSYTLLKQNLQREQNQEDIMLLDQELRNTKFLRLPSLK